MLGTIAFDVHVLSQTFFLVSIRQEYNVFDQDEYDHKMNIVVMLSVTLPEKCNLQSLQYIDIPYPS